MQEKANLMNELFGDKIKDVDRDFFHDAFWQAFTNLPPQTRKTFSAESGRDFANRIYDIYKKVK